MPKSLLQKIKERPAAGRCFGPLPWWDRLKARDPKKFAELEQAANAFWRGDYRDKFEYLRPFARFLIDEAMPEIDIQAMERFVKTYSPNG